MNDQEKKYLSDTLKDGILNKYNSIWIKAFGLYNLEINSYLSMDVKEYYAKVLSYVFK